MDAPQVLRENTGTLTDFPQVIQEHLKIAS